MDVERTYKNEMSLRSVKTSCGKNIKLHLFRGMEKILLVLFSRSQNQVFVILVKNELGYIKVLEVPI